MDYSSPVRSSLVQSSPANLRKAAQDREHLTSKLMEIEVAPGKMLEMESAKKQFKGSYAGKDLLKKPSRRHTENQAGVAPPP